MLALVRCELKQGAPVRRPCVAAQAICDDLSQRIVPLRVQLLPEQSTSPAETQNACRTLTLPSSTPGYPSTVLVMAEDSFEPLSSARALYQNDTRRGCEGVRGSGAAADGAQQHVKGARPHLADTGSW